MILTVVDFQMHTAAVQKAPQRFKSLRQSEVRTVADFKLLLSRYPDDKDGNIRLAQHLWGYNLWTRAQYLRRLFEFFESIDVVTQERLKNWAPSSNFERDFKGKIHGLGYAVYKWLVMRQGAETIKPDVHVKWFVQSVVGRPVSDEEAVNALEQVARQMGIKAYELDWRIWENSRA